MQIDDAAQQAMAALREGDHERARDALKEALKHDPTRLDFMHALAVTHVQLGESTEAHKLLSTALDVANEQRDQMADTLVPQLLLARAAAAEDLYDPVSAAADYRAVLEKTPEEPRAQLGLGHLLLGWGQIRAGQEMLDLFIESAMDKPEFIDGAKGFSEALRRFVDNDIHPKIFLEAHRGSYVEFFDHHANRMAEEGWIAEAARMHRNERGEVVPLIPEGARAYAAVRIDLVDPSSGQPGQIGDQPMVVAVADYEALSKAPVLIDWPNLPFPVWVSSQCPWDQLDIHIRFSSSSDPLLDADKTIGDWYTDGYNGKFGQSDRGRFHYISDPEVIDPQSILYHVDCGRTTLSAIDDLFQRLEILAELHPIASVVIGRGHLPTTAK